ncbi:aminoimidazole riboside kinase [Octadecabacter ascidiaceicola]|uniref:Aminoimidazole riboside kinase n=1 Tax=Octadecabacter ascidiaceicola TaxID=1655543 RepID=A0A238KPL2_9RHOB|nr:aminoimidazole riboside kinase [Octadecabacter ascidiaceicola]
MVAPNIRPNLINDENKFHDRIEQLLRLADIARVSDEDLNWIFQTPGQIESKVTQLQGLGPSIIILTRGSLGAHAWLTDGRSDKASCIIQVVMWHENIQSFWFRPIYLPSHHCKAQHSWHQHWPHLGILRGELGPKGALDANNPVR